MRRIYVPLPERRGFRRALQLLAEGALVCFAMASFAGAVLVYQILTTS